MKTKLKISSLVITAFTSVTGIFNANAQNNLGQECGCPPVNSRPTVLLSSLAVNGGSSDGNLIGQNILLTCNKTYILDKKIYVTDGATLTIQPGTVIKGRKYSTSDSATALIVSRGSKIIANGSEKCQIVFTAEADNLDGSFPISKAGEWGGIVLAGRASNNFKLSNNGPFTPGSGNGRMAIADGLATFEGFATSDSRLYFGADLNGTVGPVETFDDNDNSGILRYVSIRHSGAILQVGGEVNAISLGSVGAGTTIEHIEVISCDDDNLEFWGGKVNVKYFTSLFGNDDMFDWDCGYTGKAQFIFGITTSTNDTLGALKDADNGFEMDADDQRSNQFPRSHPVIYNATMISNGKKVQTADNSGPAAIQAKEITEGEIYNSIFANFRFGLNLRKAVGSRTGGYEAYHNWATNSGSPLAGSLIVKNNTFVNCLKPIAIDNNGTGTLLSTDEDQFYTTDGNISTTSVPGFNYVWSMNKNDNSVTTQFDAVPNPALPTNISPPNDGFFSTADYRGAFSATGKNWLSEWSYAKLLNVTAGLQPCPTDINQDGVTDNVDFLILLGQFGQSCQ